MPDNEEMVINQRLGQTLSKALTALALMSDIIPLPLPDGTWGCPWCAANPGLDGRMEHLDGCPIYLCQDIKAELSEQAQQFNSQYNVVAEELLQEAEQDAISDPRIND